MSVRRGAAKRWRTSALRALLLISTLIFVSPVLWVVLMSFRPTPALMSGLRSITSTDVTLENYQTLFNEYEILRFIGNSLIGAAIPAVVAVFVALLAGYSLVRFRTRATPVFQSMPLFAQVVPAILIVIPLYSVFLFLGLLNTYTGIVLAHIALVLPLAVWMMTGYLQAIPVEIEEAAMVDGCSRVGAVFRIVLPLALSGVAATALVAFVTAWGEFLFAFVLLSGESRRLMSVALFMFMPTGQTPTTWGLLFAAAVAFMIPSLLLFPALQRLMSKGATAGAVQGL
jgi:ABC-type glycerol-3-phosphate transport system permease component